MISPKDKLIAEMRLAKFRVQDALSTVRGPNQQLSVLTTTLFDVTDRCGLSKEKVFACLNEIYDMRRDRSAT